MIQTFTFLILSILLLVTACDKEVSKSPLEPEVPKGFIYIDSEPDGFTIFQNGRNTGRLTPDSISYIEAGEYEITLKRKYFKDTSMVVILGEDEKVSVDFNISANPSMYGDLILQSQPEGASITLNDSSLNKVTPYTMGNLWPGEYHVKYKLINHRDINFTAIVQSSKTNSYTKELRDTTIWVDFQIFNSDIQSNTLTALAVDKNNVKWIGTEINGLIRYDEVSFINFNTSNSSITSNKINCISVDEQNRIWIGTNEGLCIYDGNLWISYNNTNSGLVTNTVNVIKFDGSGTAWIGTSDDLTKFDGINWSIYNQVWDRDWIQSLHIENENKVWIGTKLDGIWLFENQYFNLIYQGIYHFPSKTINSIEKDNLGNVWFCFSPDTAGRGGVSFYDGTSFTNFLLGTFQNSVNNVFIDYENNKWVSTTEGLVLFNSQNSTTLFNTFNSLISSDNVRASVRDENGNVWITTIGGGLNKYKPPPE